jgi:hypothetical protein
MFSGSEANKNIQISETATSKRTLPRSQKEELKNQSFG